MSDIGQFPPGLGYAWRGDWKERLLDLVQVRGYTSVSEFVDAHPWPAVSPMWRELGNGDRYCLLE